MTSAERRARRQEGMNHWGQSRRYLAAAHPHAMCSVALRMCGRVGRGQQERGEFEVTNKHAERCHEDPCLLCAYRTRWSRASWRGIGAHPVVGAGAYGLDAGRGRAVHPAAAAGRRFASSSSSVGKGSAGRGCRGLPVCVSRWVRCASGLCWATLVCTALLMVGGISGAAAEERGRGSQGCSWHYNDLHWNLDPLGTDMLHACLHIANVYTLWSLHSVCT